MTPRFGPRVDVGQMHFDDRFFDGGDGVAQRIRIVRERPGVEHDDVGIRCMKRVKERAFVVRLERFDFHRERVAERLQPFVDGVEGGGAVNRRLARAEQIEVGAVQDQDFHWP